MPPRIPNEFDPLIKAASRQYLPEVDWLLYKAQLFQESWMEPNARSAAGAMGIAQFMPATWREVAEQLKLPAGASPMMPEHAIPAGAYYMARMRRAWMKSEIDPKDRHRFALASYNAGAGNIGKAWRAAGKPAFWWAVEETLPTITGRHAEETIQYVVRVYRWFELLGREA